MKYSLHSFFVAIPTNRFGLRQYKTFVGTTRKSEQREYIKSSKCSLPFGQKQCKLFFCVKHLHIFYGFAFIGYQKQHNCKFVNLMFKVTGKTIKWKRCIIHGNTQKYLYKTTLHVIPKKLQGKTYREKNQQMVDHFLRAMYSVIMFKFVIFKR